uniref:Uncharacterized protein n=1 Tax=Timema poppense TaxID=170557 RepID=A0A7R9CRW9_TIMPO|nr:unnamed protein product [Timema poppensis]
MIVALKGLRVMTWIEEGTKAVLSELSPDGSKRSPGSCSTPTSSCGVRGGGGSGDAEVKEEPSPTAKSGGGLEDNLLTALEPDTINTVLEALKTRIRELEGETRVAGNDKFKCLICMVLMNMGKFIRLGPNEKANLMADTCDVLNRWNDFFSPILNIHEGSDLGEAIEIYTSEPLVPEPIKNLPIVPPCFR